MRNRKTLYVFGLINTFIFGIVPPACGDDDGGQSDTDGDVDGDVDGDTDSDTDNDADADTDTDTDTDADGDGDGDNDTDTDADTDNDTDTDGDGDSDADADSDSDTDMSTACIGIPLSCETMLSDCETQSGCTASSGGCSGISHSCYSYDGDQFGCENVMGCTWDESCGGFADSCSLMFSISDCTNQDGCTWSSSTDSCTGVAESCSSFYSEFDCDYQEGCEWEASCDGAAVSCASLDTASCALQDGCSVTDGCGGVPLDCDVFPTESKCGDQWGCWWSTGGMSDGGAATAKFCNALVMGGENVVLDVAITAGTKSVTLSADSGECTTDIGAACLEAPIGDVVHIAMSAPDGTVIDDTVLIGVENGDEIIITNDAEFSPEVLAAVIEAPDTCSSVGFVE